MFLTDFSGTPRNKEQFPATADVPGNSTGNTPRNTPNVPPQGIFEGIVPVFLKKYKSMKAVNNPHRNRKSRIFARVRIFSF